MHISNQEGFSLIELLVAMLLGVIVLGGSISIFSGTMYSAHLNQSLVNLQSNARFATELISNDLRMAGYQGCAPSTPGSLVISAENAPTNDYSLSAVRGAVVGANSWTPAEPAGYTAPDDVGAPIVGTHVLMVQYASAPGNRLTSSMLSNGSEIELHGENNALKNDTFAVISSCSGSDLFAIDSTATADGNLNVTPESNLSQAYHYNDDAQEAVRVMPFRSAMYYVGNTGRTTDAGDEIHSLYLQTFPYDLEANPPLEITEGVEQIQLSLGVKTGDDTVFHYPDSATLDFTNVDLVKVGLLLATRDQFADASVTRPHYLADTVIPVEGNGTALTYPDDKRIRVAFNLSVKIRNRNL